ncbi:type III PLP-dependent enzyme [Arthrobacter sp. E44]|uniref:type III PLP-dependent enzyme n=1 Tax=Arthrobacter sp. E44 TaxID=3341794 RepID=UPI0035A6DC5E
MKEIAEQYGTPAFVYDLGVVQEAHMDLRRALPSPTSLYYSLKANPHPEVVAFLHALGCRSEVSSIGEVTAAINAGVPADEILLTGPGKSAEMLRDAIGQGVRRFSVESADELSRIDDVSGDAGITTDCLVRVNADISVPGAGLNMTGTASQFGIDYSKIVSSPEAFSDLPNARVIGLHLYMGTNLSDTDSLLAQFAVGLDIASSLMPTMPHIREIDLGGGFGAPYGKEGTRPTFPGLATALEDLLDDKLPGWREGHPEVTFESGRYLVGECGTILSRVVDQKTSKGTVFTILDTGVHHFGGMSGLRRIPNISPQLTRVGTDVEVPFGHDTTVETTLVGPLCTPLDVLGRGSPLPRLRSGDLVMIPNAGAYGPTASLIGFLGHPAPVEVILRDGRVHSASRLTIMRETRKPSPTRGHTN